MKCAKIKIKVSKVSQKQTLQHYGMVSVIDLSLKSQCFMGMIHKILSPINISQQDAPARRPKH